MIDPTFILQYKNENNDLCARSLTKDGLGDEIIIFDSAYKSSSDSTMDILYITNGDAREILKEYNTTRFTCFRYDNVSVNGETIWKFLQYAVFIEEAIEAFIQKFTPKQ